MSVFRVRIVANFSVVRNCYFESQIPTLNTMFARNAIDGACLLDGSAALRRVAAYRVSHSVPAKDGATSETAGDSLKTYGKRNFTRRYRYRRRAGRFDL